MHVFLVSQQYSWWLADPGAPPVGRSARTWTTAKVSEEGSIYINFIFFFTVKFIREKGVGSDTGGYNSTGGFRYPCREDFNPLPSLTTTVGAPPQGSDNVTKRHNYCRGQELRAAVAKRRHPAPPSASQANFRGYLVRVQKFPVDDDKENGTTRHDNHHHHHRRLR